MVAKDPKSLQDILEGDVIGAGYHSLVTQLQNSIENVRPSTTPKIRKIKHHSDTDDTDKVSPEQRAAVQDTYGCINWNLRKELTGPGLKEDLSSKLELKGKMH